MKSISYFDKSANCFGYFRHSPLTIFTGEFADLKDKIRADAIKYLFADRSHMFDEIEKISREEIAANRTGFTSFDLELGVEKRLHFSQNQNGFVQKRMKERCYRIEKQLSAAISDCGLRFNPADKLLDVGAGSGLNAQLLKHELDLNYVLLTDVVDYRYNEVRNTPGIDFKIFKSPYNHIDTDQQFQLGIITNTLHHCDYPFEVFETMTSKMSPDAIVLVIESCIGVSTADVRAAGYSSVIPFQTLYDDHSSIQEDQAAYLGLSDEHKMIYGIFFDWLYNRVFLNENINVPYNFGKPADWNAKFEQLGYQVLKTYLMGFDQPAALEFHTLHVLKYRP